MMIFPTEREVFSEIKDLCDAFYDRDTALPQYVFRKTASVTKFCEFDEIIADDFWPFIVECAKCVGDVGILAYSVNPTPDDYYFQEFGFYAVARWTTEDDADDYAMYFDTAPAGSPTDALVYRSEAVAIFSESGQFALWGQRDLDLAVLAYFGTDRNDFPLESSHARFFDAFAAAEIAIRYGGHRVRSDIAEQLVSSYRP